VLTTLLTEPERWHHGYDLARRTGLRSGTLYPILARLAERGYLERRWEPDPPSGRPPRHLYRLTDDGLAVTDRLLSAGTSTSVTPAPRPGRLRPT
jgi:DNA-binding PadR family transcriptional regulator